MNRTPWMQMNLRFRDPAQAEHIAVTLLAPALIDAENEGLITAWFFVRKKPVWRLRCLATDAVEAHSFLHRHLGEPQLKQHLTEVTEIVYEPETHAFGGAEGITVAHRLWHLDSRHLLTHLGPTPAAIAHARRRELSILLCSTMLRAAGLDWYEQGDVWTRVAAHRHQPPEIKAQVANLTAHLQRLMSVDSNALTGTGGPLATTADWMSAYAAAGRDVGQLAAAGLLHRGLRDILAHHVIFAWNRIGLSAATQSVLAAAAVTVVFGSDPAGPVAGATGCDNRVRT